MPTAPAHERTPPIRAHQQRRAQRLAIRQRHRHARRIALDRRHRHRLDHLDRAAAPSRALIERQPHVPRFQHQPERLVAVAQLGAIEMQMQQRRPAARSHADAPSVTMICSIGCATSSSWSRQPKRAPHPVRRKRNRERAPVETSAPKSPPASPHRSPRPTRRPDPAPAPASARPGRRRRGSRRHRNRAVAHAERYRRAQPSVDAALDAQA